MRLKTSLIMITLLAGIMITGLANATPFSTEGTLFKEYKIASEQITTAGSKTWTFDNIGGASNMEMYLNASTGTITTASISHYPHNSGKLISTEIITIADGLQRIKGGRVTVTVRGHNGLANITVSGNILFRLGSRDVLALTGVSNVNIVNAAGTINNTIKNNMVNRVVTPSVGTSVSSPAYQVINNRTLTINASFKTTVPTYNNGTSRYFQLTTTTKQFTIPSTWNYYVLTAGNSDATAVAWVSAVGTPNIYGSGGGMFIPPLNALNLSSVLGNLAGSSKLWWVATKITTINISATDRAVK